MIVAKTTLISRRFRDDSRREGLIKHLRARRKELRSLRSASHTQQNQTVAISTVLQAKLVADRKQEEIKAQHTYELHCIPREDAMENKRKFVIEVCAQAMIPKQEISEVKFTDSRKAYGQQYASVTFNNRGNRRKLGEHMSYVSSIKYWSEGSEWQLYVVTGRYTETKDTQERI